ncbi:hypothetical protein DEO72_LG9g1598 [Vigna unguiculata]|uniref:Uncharacterized protein n=1 Tax=Vigna unguiculata TaxID=3917 RepID=A0A4D6N126_VIGUN|nr:hypothetical protein DEO72_LG9g1598 [Vigna unguiculata]
MQVTSHFSSSLLYVIGRECPSEYPHILFSITHAPQRFEEYNVYEALSSTSHVSNIDCGYDFTPQRFP